MHPGTTIYTSHRLEDLLVVLVERLATDPLPPLDTETIVVPGQGIARWLRLQLAERLGIAAGLAMPFPGAFLQQLTRAANTARHAAQAELFDPDTLLLRIHRLLGDAALQKSLGLAARYCEDDPDGKKRLQLSQRLTSCFDDYQLYRGDLLDRAAAGDDLTDHGPHGAWQARLWRALLRDAGFTAAAAPSSPTPLLFAELIEPSGDDGGPWLAHRLQSLQRMLADPKAAVAALPPRLSVFAASTLPPALVALLFRIGELIPVALYVPTPSPHYFGDLRPRGASITDGNSLLARLGTESREFQDILLDLQDAAGTAPVERHDLGESSPAVTTNLLACLHHDLAAVREHGQETDLPRFQLTVDDDSVRVHDCHSEHRELEVVRDQILDAFARDPSLQPHDVLVLVPDIERYSPYVEAVFGPVQRHLPFQVADKSPIAEQPICAALFGALRLAESRLQVYDVLHLLETPAVQRRFGLFASDLPVLRHVCERAGIRWGLDGDSRNRRFGMPAFEENSWRLGIERMLLGVATGPVDDLVLGRLPAADRTSAREDLLERFLAFLGLLFERLRPLQRPHTFAEWASLLDDLCCALFLPLAEDEAGLAALRSALADLRDAADRARHNEPISPRVLRDWLQGALGRAADGIGFLGGRVTVAAMLPMRAVPVRQLFLCGLDDRSFPRRTEPAPFDLGQNPRRPGDRSPRLDDRQLFLDCLLAARERLHLCYIGHSAMDDSECAPSVVLAELIDYCDRISRPPTGHDRARDWLVVRHPLQPWSPRYRDGKDPRLFAYAATQAANAAAQAANAVDPSPIAAVASSDELPWFGAALPAAATVPTTDIPLAVLLDFWWHPCRFFLRHALGIRLPRDLDTDPTTESFATSPLDRWRLVDAAVQRVLDRRPPPRDALALASASGLLPVGGGGAQAHAAIDEESLQFLGELGRHGELAPRQVVARGPDFTIAGEIATVGEGELVYARVGKVKPKDRLRAWIWHTVAAVARHQGTALPARTMLIARDATLCYRELEPAVADECLADLVAGLRQGITMPLPFFERSSHEYGAALHASAADEAAAQRKARSRWLPDTSDFRGSDSEDHSIALCMRDRDALALPEFATWARRIWRMAYGYTEALS
ncbi:MAG: exodeoxyribonuclease V subunit gamma [Planctomycetes bacterium]|nr:exodeoxyribonuclease V subunit gamma [Planctomycetota bacterium]